MEHINPGYSLLSLTIGLGFLGLIILLIRTIIFGINSFINK